MYEMKVSGEMAAVGWRDGSSGKFAGDIEGLYEGYRVGHPERQYGTMELAHGTLALVLEKTEDLSGERGVNPFAEDTDPLESVPSLEEMTAFMRGEGPMPKMMEGMGAPPFAGGRGGPPPFLAGGGPPPFASVSGGPPRSQGAGGTPALKPGEDGLPAFLSGEGGHTPTTLTLKIDGEKSTGVYTGASGDIQINAPAFKEAGYLIVTTGNGDLRLTFLEGTNKGRLEADLWVDGENSTGIYHNARGELQFSLQLYMFGGAKGPYSGTVWLEQAPPQGHAS